MILVTPVQPLILTGAGTKPTVPTPSTISPIDSRFVISSDIMIGQLAYNVDDDIWYYRHSTGIKPLGGGEITTNDVEVWRIDKIYRAGNVFVSYVNELSGNPQFQTAAIYRCIINTVVGESPETTPSKWEYQGASVNFDNMSADNVIYDNTVSGLTADRVKTAIDELAASIVSLNIAKVPTGGTTGQVLSKTSASDYAMAWEDVVSGQAYYTAKVNISVVMPVDSFWDTQYIFTDADPVSSGEVIDMYAGSYSIGTLLPEGILSEFYLASKQVGTDLPVGTFRLYNAGTSSQIISANVRLNLRKL